MERSPLALPSILASAVLLASCHTSVVGHYRLDVDETKKCVEQQVAEKPELAKLKDYTLKLFDATDLDVTFGQDGKMQSKAVVKLDGKERSDVAQGTWKLDGKQLSVSLGGKLDTTCDVDGKRLRCERKEAFYELFGKYVLVKQ